MVAHGVGVRPDRLRVQQCRHRAARRRPRNQRLHELSREAFDRMLAVNLTGVFSASSTKSRRCWRSGGAIVNTASVAV